MIPENLLRVDICQDEMPEEELEAVDDVIVVSLPPPDGGDPDNRKDVHPWAV